MTVAHEHTRDRSDAVMALLMEVRPGLLTVDEVMREAAVTPTCWDDRDDAKTALDRLVASGRVHQHGDLVFVARAAALAYEAGRP